MSCARLRRTRCLTSATLRNVRLCTRATGAWGWAGGSGTTAAVDPSLDTVAVLLTQRAMAGPDDNPQPFHDAVAAAAR